MRPLILLQFDVDFLGRNDSLQAAEETEASSAEEQLAEGYSVVNDIRWDFLPCSLTVPFFLPPSVE